MNEYYRSVFHANLARWNLNIKYDMGPGTIGHWCGIVATFLAHHGAVPELYWQLWNDSNKTGGPMMNGVGLRQRQHSRTPPRCYYQRPSPLTLGH